MVRLRVLPVLFFFALPLLAQNDDCNRPGRPPVNPKLCKHSNFFEPAHVWNVQTEERIAKYKPKGLKYDAYLAVGYDLANTILLRNRKTGEVVFVDTLGDAKTVGEVLPQLVDAGALKSATNVPIRALVYTHNHIDHTGGVLGFISASATRPCHVANPDKAGPDGIYDADKTTPNCTAVIGQEKITDSVINTGTVVGTIINARSTYMYGSFLVPNGIINDGIGPKVNIGPSGYRMPSRTFTNELKVHAAGLWMKLIYVPSETDDELAVFLPDALNSIDGKDPKYASTIADAWDELKHSKPAPAIFWQFIETERNNIVKEYEIGAGQGVTVYLGQTRPADNHYLINVGPYQGREQREVLAEAIAWWEEYLANIDKRAAG